MISVSLVKSEIEHKEPIIVGFFILQYTNLRKLELYCNFFDNYCDVKKFEELEMDADSLYLALSEQDFYNCIQPQMKKEWNSLRCGDCTDEFSAKTTTYFLPRNCCAKHKKHDRRETALFK